MSPTVQQKLRSGDEAQIRGVLDDVRVAGKGGQAAAPAIAEVLARGLSLALTEAAITTLGEVEAESASSTIAAYAAHRNLTIRRAAVKALIRTKGAAATKALRRALTDPDAAVRGFAATGLGTLKSKDSMPDLLVALDRKVPEAATAIGQVCTGADCDKLTAKLGRLPFDVVTGGLDQILFRPQPEMSDDEKLKIVNKLRELGTQEANRFLSDVQKRWPQGWSPRVKQSIDQGVLATQGGSQ
jgi:HEAT repeat protein